MLSHQLRPTQAPSANIGVSLQLMVEGMKDIAEIRIDNLERLVVEMGTLTRVADAAQTTPIYLSQVRRRSAKQETGKQRTMGSEIARRIEAGCKKPSGWMDHDHTIADEGLRLVTDASSAEYIRLQSNMRSEWHGVELATAIAMCPLVPWSDLPMYLTVDNESAFVSDKGFQLLPVFGPAGARSKWALVQDDALSPDIKAGHAVCIDPDATCGPGDTVVVQDHSGNLYLRLYGQHGSDWQAVSPNSTIYPPMAGRDLILKGLCIHHLRSLSRTRL